MAWRCKFPCMPDQFCDISTATCMNCQYVCKPGYQTSSECNRLCPDWKAVTQPTSMTTPCKDDSNPPANIDIFTVVIVSTAVSIAAIILLFIVLLIRIHRRRRANSSRGSDVENHYCCEPQLRAPGLCANRETSCCCCCCVLDGCSSNKKNEKEKLKLMPDEHSGAEKEKDVNVNTDVSDKFSYSSDQDKVSEDSGRGTASSQSDLNQNTSLSSVSQSTNHSGSTQLNKSNQQQRSHSKTHIPSRPYVMPDDQRQLSRTSSGGTLSLNLRFESSNGLSLSLQTDGPYNFKGDSTMGSGHSQNTVLRGHWNSVMKVYDHIDKRLHEMPWIAGCMISNTVLKVVINEEGSLNKEKCTRKIRNIIPADISSDRFLLTFEGPAVQTTSGQFGSGSMVCVQDGRDGERWSTVTATARCTSQSRLYIPKTYIFSSGHSVRAGQPCLITSNDDIKKETIQATCIAQMDTIKQKTKRDIKQKLYDLAMIKVNGDISFSNSRKFVRNGQELTLRVKIKWDPISVRDLQPGKKVLILTNNKILEGILDPEKVACTCLVRKCQMVNLIQITSRKIKEQLVIQGHSGSLVTWYPDAVPNADNSVTVAAFAVIAGFDPDNSAKGLALPLADQMQELLGKDPQFEGFEENLKFDDYIPDSGVYC